MFKRSGQLVALETLDQCGTRDLELTVVKLARQRIGQRLVGCEGGFAGAHAPSALDHFQRDQRDGLRAQARLVLQPDALTPLAAARLAVVGQLRLLTRVDGNVERLAALLLHPRKVFAVGLDLDALVSLVFEIWRQRFIAVDRLHQAVDIGRQGQALLMTQQCPGAQQDVGVIDVAPSGFLELGKDVGL